MSGQTTVNINGYSVDDNFKWSDDLFNIATGATLVLLGESTLTDDAIEGAGRVSLLGTATIDDGLALSDGLFVDMDAVTQNGALDLGSGGDQTGTVRNIASATWTLNGDIKGSLIGSTAQFVNLGLLDVDAPATIDANFYDRGGTIEINGPNTVGDFGYLLDVPIVEFHQPITRFVDDTIGGTGTFGVSNGTLVNSQISAENDVFTSARIVGNVNISSSSVEVGHLNVAAGASLDITNSAAQVILGAGGNVVGDGLTGFVDNNGAIESSANLDIASQLTGVGVVEVGPENVTLDSTAGIHQTLNFNVGDTSLTPTLILNDASDFNATISGFDKGAGADDKITLNSTSGGAPWQFQGYQSSSGALDFTNASGGTAAVHLAGVYNADDFHAVVSGGSTTITYG